LEIDVNRNQNVQVRPLLTKGTILHFLLYHRFAEAERDCTLGLKLDSKNVKALWRRGIARRSLGKVDEAKEDFETALTIDPANKAVKEELTKLKQGTAGTPSSTAKSSTAKPSTTVPPASKPPAKPNSAKKLESPASESSKPPVISSKRVLIKEVENDEDSELFSPVTTKRIAAEPPAVSTITPTEAIPKPVAVEVTKPVIVEVTKTASSPISPPPSAPATSLSKPIIPPTTTSSSSPKTNMTAPSTTLDFQRDWKSYSKNDELLYQYIKVRPRTR
jgi:tetratricopeptide (TPR) repeat protein